MRYTILALLMVAAAGYARAAEPASGKDLYVRYCSSCHGLDGKSGTALAKRFAVPPPDLTRIAIRRDGWFPEVMVREIIDGRHEGHGPREMPVWGSTLDREQLIAITEYLYSLQQEGPS